MKKAPAHVSSPRPARASFTLPARLVGALALLGLVGALGLVASRPAHTAGGPVPVTVANAPLAVTAADNPAKQPFQAFVIIRLPKGQTFVTDLNTSIGRTIPVPASKRLVIQMVSVWRSGTLTPGEGVRAYVGCMVSGHEIFYPLPFAPTDGTAVPGAMQAVTLYADSGTNLEFNAFRSGDSGDEADFVSVTGYLVDI